MKNFSFSSTPQALFTACAAVFGLIGSMGVQAAPTDISKTPLTVSKGVKPNVMLLMDTSNSMTWTHMPDTLEVPGAKQSIGYKSHLCNSIYYDHTKVYKAPKMASGASYPAPTFSAAPYNFYLTPATTVNLSTGFQAHDANSVLNLSTSLPDTAQAAYYFRFTPTATVTKPTPADCAQPEPLSGATTPFAATSGAQWTKIIVSGTSGAGLSDERPNFAMWYTYYRTRMLMAKSAIGTALSSTVINDTRVGLVTVQPGSPVLSSNYLKIDDFSGAHKTNFFNKLTGLTTGGSSPAREGLARVGRHFAGQTNGINNGMPDDPMTASCQSNYTILTTDGYWNAQQETVGPVRIDGTTLVGQQDGDPVRAVTPDSGDTPRGVYDGTPASIRNESNTTQYRGVGCSLLSDGTRTRTVRRTVDQQVRTETIPAPNNAFQRRTITTTQSTYTTTRTRRLQTDTSYNLSSSWAEWKKLDESIVVIASCPAPGPGTCTPFSYGPVSVPSCPWALPATAFGAPNCVTSTSVPVWRATCTPSATRACGAIENTLVDGNSCVTDITQTCTSTPPVVTVVPTCTAGFDVGTKITTSCPAPTYGPPTTVSSCTSSSTVQCTPICTGVCTPTVTVTPGVSCTPSATVTCTYAPVSGPTVVDPTTCTVNVAASAGNGWQRTTCTPTLSPMVAASGICTPIPATGPFWVETQCFPGGFSSPTGTKLQRRVRTDVTITPPGGPTGPVSTSTTGWADVTPVNCVPSAAFVAPPNTTVVSPPTPVGATSSLNSLADVAQYYYLTDLRTGAQPHANPNDVKVSGSGWNDDKVQHQHMTTFVIGLGVSGTKTYDPNYKTATTGDFGAIRSATGYWPVWPDLTLNYSSNYLLYHDPRSIDDFWHTAVNGRGQYFSANDPDAVTTGLRDAFGTILGAVGAGAGSVLSDGANLTSDGLAFATEFNNGKWWGDLKAFDSTGSLVWNAKSKLAGQVSTNCDSRNIYVRNSAAPDGLAEFSWNTLKCGAGAPTTSLTPAQQAFFNASMLSQYGGMDAAQVLAATGSSLVNFLRGQTLNEGFAPGAAGKLYRKRDFALGDIIGSRPAYVAEPYFNYADPGYVAFKTSPASVARRGMVYVGANDGMLHAFYASKITSPSGAPLPADPLAGQEAWAYIPSAVLPKMHKLANDNYNSNNEIFVNGTPVIGDVKSGSTWRTILVGGLGAGGAGYFALDITDPTSPKSLWEFDTSSSGGADLGLSLGEPIIIKLTSGQWVVMLSSGYNNSSGRGKLFILDAVTGALVRTMDTGVGSAADPSGLAQLSAWVEAEDVNYMAQRVYGGDLLGNVWRFDVNDNILPSGYEVVRIATLKDNSGTPQPITAAMALGRYNKTAYIFVGTGQLLGASDMTTTQTQSMYAIVDPLNANNPVYPDSPGLRTLLKPLRTDSTLGIACASGSCSGSYPTGWMLDLSISGERVNIMPVVLRKTLVFVTNKPVSTGSSCTANMESIGYAVDPVSASAIGFVGGAAGSAGKQLYAPRQATVGLTFVYKPKSTYSTPGGKGDDKTDIIATGANGGTEVVKIKPVGSPGSAIKRFTWRGLPAN